MARMRTLHGATLVELVVMLVVVGVAIAMASSFFGNILRAYIVGTEAATDTARAQLALERMSRELRTIRSATSADLTPAATRIAFVEKSSGNIIGYDLLAGSLRRTMTPAGTPIVLADSVSALAFGYLTANGRSELTSPATSVALIAYINARFTVSSDNITVGYSTTVRPTDF